MNKAKMAADRRADMAVKIVQAFDSAGKPYTCSASMVHDPDMMALAHQLASAALGEGLAFGSSQSKRDSRHVASLVLSDASRLYYYGRLAHVQDVAA